MFLFIGKLRVRSSTVFCRGKKFAKISPNIFVNQVMNANVRKCKAGFGALKFTDLVKKDALFHPKKTMYFETGKYEALYRVTHIKMITIHLQ